MKRFLSGAAFGTAIIISIFLQMQSAFAWPPTYSREFEFSNPAILTAHAKRKVKKIPKKEELAAVTAFVERVKELCGQECYIEKHDGKFSPFGIHDYKVTFKNGYSFNISQDQGCVEIQTAKETLKDIQKFEEYAEKYIFSVAKDVGLSPKDMDAHFNVGILSAFEARPRAFLRTFVNYHNKPELASGALGKNYDNAPPISHLKPQQQAALAKIVDEVNQGKIKTVQEVALRITKDVYTHSTWGKAGAYHYQGIGMKYVLAVTNLASDKPFEIRGLRQPKTAREATLLAELMEKRMAFEIVSRGPIVFLDLPETREFTPSTLANNFRLFVAEMAEEGQMEADWNKFKALLPDNLQKIEADAFMSGKKINWASARDVQAVKYYTRYLVNSPWVRDRMKSILETPQAFASKKIPQIFAAAKKQLGPNANAQAREILDEFIASVQPGPQKRQVANVKIENQTVKDESLAKPASCATDFAAIKPKSFFSRLFGGSIKQ